MSNWITRFGLVAAMATAGCGAGDQPPGEGEGTKGSGDRTGSATQAIEDGVEATSTFSKPSVMIQTVFNPLLSTFCTGSIIDSRHVLTASHCLAFPFQDLGGGLVEGTIVNFYGSSPLPDGLQGTVTEVFTAPGVDPQNEDYTDSNGNWADYAVLTLASAIPSSSSVQVMAHSYPGSGVSGTLVGCGEINGGSNNSFILMTRTGPDTSSSDDGGGWFHLDGVYTDDGDSGGPFRVSGMEVGELYGYEWDYVHAEYQNKYTSVPFHLDRILTHLGFHTTLSTLSNTGLSGTVSEIFWSTEQVCAYACQNESSCQGFLFNGALCELFSSVTGTFSDPGVTSGEK